MATSQPLSLPTRPSDLTIFDQHDESDSRNLYNSLRDWKSYPYNLGASLQPRNRLKLFENIRRQHDRTKYTALLFLDESWGRARKNAIERRIQTVWFDCNNPNPPTAGTLDFSSSSTGISDSKPDLDFDKPRKIKSNDQLEEFFCITNADSLPSPDPLCRFIFLESSAPASPRLKITDEMLLKILTYHDVTPYFLNHISHICHEPPTGVSEAPFGEFHSLKSFFPSQSPSTKALDRSGLTYQLVFELKTVINPFGADDGATVATSGDDLNIWPITQCAIYHRFDVLTGKSLWIMTPPVGDWPSSPWSSSKTSKELLSSFGVPSTSPSTAHCFASTLSVMTWLADWSLSEYDLYLATLDEQMQILSLPYINAKESGRIDEITLKAYSQYMETLDQCIVTLESNLRMLREIVRFYCDNLFNDRHLLSLGLEWTSSNDGDEVRERVEQFRIDITSVCNSIEEMILRAGTVKQIGTRRESTALRLLQNRDAVSMARLQKGTYSFSAITLILLPISVVSTIFSTDIVKFSIPNRANTDGYIGSWSAPAVVWWMGTTILVTALIGAWGAWGRRMSYNSAGGTEDENVSEEVSSKERFERVVTHVKRGYWDLEDRGRARVQWVKGNVAKIRQRVEGGRSEFGSGLVEGIIDPERADGGGEK